MQTHINWTEMLPMFMMRDSFPALWFENAVLFAKFLKASQHMATH